MLSKMASHMVEGLMIHDQISQAFCYLGLYGYEKIHLHQYEEESKSYKNISRYYILRKGRPVTIGRIEDPGIINQSWFSSHRLVVKPSTRKQIISDCFERWVKWEEDTKCLYQKLYVDVLDAGEVSDAAEILTYVVDVDKELVKAQDILARLSSIDFDLVAIMDEQASVYDRFLNA